MSQLTDRLIRVPVGRTPDQPNEQPVRLIRGVSADTPDQPNRQPTRRVPVTRRILAELDRAPNLPLVSGYLGRWGYPGPLTGFPEGRTYVELARAVYETPEPTDAHVKAVQRAAKRLVAAGRIETSRGSDGVVVRRLRTEADYECRAEVERQAREWKVARAEAEANATAYPVDTGYGGIVDVPVEPVLIITECGVEVRKPEEEEAGTDPLRDLLRALPAGGGS
jgi:hypothetical protein